MKRSSGSGLYLLMGWLSDASETVQSWVAPEAAPAPAPVDSEQTSQWDGWIPGSSSGADAAAAFPHYTEEPELPTGLISDEQINAINEAALSAGESAELPTGLLSPDEMEAIERRAREAAEANEKSSDEAAMTDTLDAITPEQRAEMVRKMETQGPPTGLLTEEQIAEVNGREKPAVDAPPMTPEEASAAAAAAVKQSLEMVNETVAKAKADQIAEIAMKEEEEQFRIFGSARDDKRDALVEQLEDLTPDMRARVVAQLGKREGEAALPEEALDTVKDANDDVAAAEERAKKTALKVDNAVKVAEASAEKGNTKAIENSLDGLSEKRREEAMDKMSPEARAVAEEAMEKRRERLGKLAERLEKAQHGTGVTDCTDEVGIVTGLSGLSESEAEELEEIYGEKFKDGDKARSLEKDLKKEFGNDDKESKFISAVFDGDKEKADEMSVDLAVSYLEDEATAILNSDEDAMNDLLRAHNKNPAAAKRIADAYHAKTGKELSAACEKVMDEGEYKEASANIEGDPRTANVAVLEQGNGERTERVIEEVESEPGGLEQLAQDTQEHTGKKLDQVLDGQLPDDKAKTIEDRVESAQDKITEARDKKLNDALDKLKSDPDPKKFEEANKKAEDVASKLSTSLSQMHVVGNNTDVTQHLRGLDAAEVALVMQHYEKMTESLGEKKNLEEDLRAKLEGKDLKVANAALSGDKVLTAVALVEQSADNVGTDVEGWKKAMETLKTPEERAQFKEMIGKHVGGKDAYEKLVKSETSSFERDTLNAMAIVDEDERAGTMAQVEFTKNAYGGKLAGYMESLGDLGGDLVGESDAERAKRRQEAREYDVVMRFSNLGGSEDAQLDAMAGLQNEKQLAIFNNKVKSETGKTTEEVVEEEMSDHHAEAGKKFARNQYEDAQAERMVAELDCIVDDREDAASKPFEQVRLKADAQERIGKIPEGPDRDKAIEAEKKLARESLLEKADEAARKAGHESYMAMLEKELKPSELEVAKERIADGKVSDATALFQAGDTSVGNLGKDSGKFYEVMQDKTPDQMNDLRKDFQAKHPDLDFDEWVRSKATSDGQKRDFEIMLEGNYARMAPDKLAEKAADPDGQRALIKRVKDLEEAARGGASDREYDPIGNAKRKVGNAIGNELADTIGNAGDRLDGRVEAVTKLEAKLDAGETLSSEEQEELVTHMRYMAGDQKAYTDTKTSAVNVGAEVVGTVVEVGTVALTGNDTLATAAGGLAKMEVKGTFDPGRFGADEMVAEGIGILADTAGSALGGKFKTPGVGEFAEGALGGLGSELGNTQNWNDPGKLLDASMRSAATQGTSAVLSAGAEAVVGEGLAGKLATATVEELATGDESQTFKQRFTNVAKSAAQDMASGAASSHHQKHHGNSDAPSSTPPASEATAHEKQSHEKPSVETPAHETPAHEKPSVETPSHETPAPQTPAHERNPLDASEPSSDPKKKGPETIDDLAAQSPDLRSANPKDLATAKTKLATGDALDSREMQAVLDLAVNAARQAVERDGFSIDNKELGGLCGPMQHQVTQVLQHVLGDGAQVVTHASHHARAGEEAGSARGLPGKLQSTDTDHSYTTIHMPDGRAFLVDPSFGQFANPTAAVGNRLLAENGGEMGAALMKNGFIELTPEAANAYGRALTGKDTEFTVDDFAESSRNPALSPEKLRDKSAIADAKQLWDSVFEIKDVGSDEPPVSDPTPSTDDVSIHPIVSVYGVPDMTPDPNVDLSPVDLKAMNETDRAAEAADVEKARREMRTPAQKVGDASSAGVGVVDKFLTKVFGINDTAVLEGATAKGAPTNDANDAVKTGGDAYTVAKALANLVRPRDKQDASAIGDGVITGLGLGAQALADAFMPGAGQVVGGMIDGAKPTLDQADTKSGVGNALRALLGGNLASAGDHITAAVQVLLPGVNFAHKSNDEKAHRDEVNARTKELVEAGMPPYEARVEARRERLDSINDLPGQDHRHLDLDADVTGEEPLRSPAQEKRIEDIQRQEQALASARVELRLAKGDPEMEAQIQQDIARYEGELGKLRVQPEDTDGVIDLSTPGGRARKEEMARQQAHLASLRAQLSLAMKQDDPVAARGIKNQIDSAEIRSRELAAVDAGSGETFATRIDIGSAEDEVEQLRVRVFDAPPEEQLALNQQIEAEENRVRALREQLAEQEALQAEAEARALERRRA